MIDLLTATLSECICFYLNVKNVFLYEFVIFVLILNALKPSRKW